MNIYRRLNLQDRQLTPVTAVASQETRPRKTDSYKGNGEFARQKIFPPSTCSRPEETSVSSVGLTAIILRAHVRFGCSKLSPTAVVRRAAVGSNGIRVGFNYSPWNILLLLCRKSDDEQIQVSSKTKPFIDDRFVLFKLFD